MRRKAASTLGTGMAITSHRPTEQHRQRPNILLPAGAWPPARSMNMHIKPIARMVMTTLSAVLTQPLGIGGERGGRSGKDGELRHHACENLPAKSRVPC